MVRLKKLKFFYMGFDKQYNRKFRPFNSFGFLRWSRMLSKTLSVYIYVYVYPLQPGGLGHVGVECCQIAHERCFSLPSELKLFILLFLVYLAHLQGLNPAGIFRVLWDPGFSSCSPIFTEGRPAFLVSRA